MIPTVETGTDPDIAATYVFTRLAPTLAGSNLQVAIIKVDRSLGMFARATSYVFVKDATGHWDRIQDKQLLAAIIKAGL
jgi:hypothetical protein